MTMKVFLITLDVFCLHLKMFYALYSGETANEEKIFKTQNIKNIINKKIYSSPCSDIPVYEVIFFQISASLGK